MAPKRSEEVDAMANEVEESSGEVGSSSSELEETSSEAGSSGEVDESSGGRSKVIPKRQRSVFVDDVAEESDDEEEHEEEEEEQRARKKGKVVARKHRRSMFIDDVAEESDDEEDEEEEDQRARKKAKGKGKGKGKPSVSDFFDEEVSVDDDEPTDNDDDDEINRDFFVLDDGTDMEEVPRSRRPQFIPEEQDLDVDEFVKQFKARHSFYEDDREEEETEVDQQALLPSARDPKLWLVKCAIGHERVTAISLMQKFIDMPELQILSVTTLDHLKGFIYIEAMKEAYVKEACKGMQHIYSWAPVKMVPLKEMTDVISIESKNSDLCKGSWVRMKQGNYKGDLGEVVNVDDVRHKVTVKLIPRINLRHLANKLSGIDVDRKQKFVPVPRLFNIREASNFGIYVERKYNRATKEYYESVNNMLFKDGFLYKTASIRSITFEKIQPTIDEITQFRKPGKNGDAEMASLIAKTKEVNFVCGDGVIITRGDLKNLMGRVEKVEDDFVHIRPERADLPRTVILNKRDLCKHFKVGVNVEVISGVQEGVKGMVLKVEDRVLVILSDTTKGEVRVFADHVVEINGISSEVTKNEDSKVQSQGRLPPRGPQIEAGRRQQHGGRRDQHDSLIGKIVKIRLGPYKGYRGRVKEIKGTQVRVELDSQMKLVYVKRDEIADISTPPTPYCGNQTPMHPSQTPLHPFSTPMRVPGATPMNTGVRSPSYNWAWAPVTPRPSPVRDDIRTATHDPA